MSNSQQCSLPTIRIKISVDEHNTGIYQEKKYVIGIIPDVQRSILDVLWRICILLELDDKPEQMKMLDDGFILPSKMGACYLKDNVIYEVMRQNIQRKMQQEQQSQSQSEKQESEKVRKHVKKSKIKQAKSSSSEDSSSQSQSSIPQKVKKPPKKTKKAVIQQSSQSESSESSDSSLVNLLSLKKQRKLQKKQIKSISRDEQKPQQSINEKKFTPKTKQSKYAEKNIPIKRLPQKIVSQSSDSSSQPIAERIKKTINQNKALDQNRKEEDFNIPVRPKKVPIAVRKKPCAPENAKNSEEAPKKGFQKFSEYLQEKWASITKQLLQGWGATHKEECILSEKNRIRFKVIELDMEKFVPKTSGWIEGFVQAVKQETEEWKIKLVNVTKQIEGEAPEKQAFMEIGLINMQQVQIHKDTFTSQQSEYFRPQEAPHPEQSHPQIEQKLSQVKISEKEVPKNTQSIQQMVCGQIHYYFSEKNYTKDLFMKMHANKNPRKFIPLRVMLNFPKIKKLSINQDTLLDYLSTDPRKNTRHYELDEQNKLIRCKKYEEYHRNDYENKQEGDLGQNIEQ